VPRVDPVVIMFTVTMFTVTMFTMVRAAMGRGAREFEMVIASPRQKVQTLAQQRDRAERCQQRNRYQGPNKPVHDQTPMPIDGRKVDPKRASPRISIPRSRRQVNT
jgi:hypothetical protein